LSPGKPFGATPAGRVHRTAGFAGRGAAASPATSSGHEGNQAAITEETQMTMTAEQPTAVVVSQRAIRANW
jgi:hypothetical protein